MRRFHLFEWGDQPWLPRVLRDYVTDHLHFFLSSEKAAPLHRAMAEIIKNALQSLGTSEIIDLCSGGGGPLLGVHRVLTSEMNFPVTAVMTDLYPNITAFRKIETASADLIRGCYDPVDAFNVPPQFTGLRTLFTAYHHFGPANARRLLTDAVVKRRGIVIFEPFIRGPFNAFRLGIVAMIRGFFLTPLVGKMSAQRLALTYILPIAPAIASWDGAVSSLRSYNIAEIRELTASLNSHAYSWKVDSVIVNTRFGPRPFTYLLGLPTNE